MKSLAHVMIECVCMCAQERDTERQRVDELLEMNMSLEADLRHSSSGGSVLAPVVALPQRFLQSELESDEELSEVIGQSTHLSAPCHLRHAN